MNDNQPVPNPALRAHVTDHSFVLTLRKTHIAALAKVVNDKSVIGRPAVEPSNPTAADYSNLAYGTLSFFIPAVGGLIRRGLLEHRHNPNFLGRKFGSDRDKLSDYYRLTRAGWAAYDLLAEAGLVPLVSTKNRLHACEPKQAKSA